MNTKSQPRVFHGVRLRSSSVDTLDQMRADLGARGLQRKPSNARAIEYALAFVQSFIDSGRSPVQEVVNRQGAIR